MYTSRRRRLTQGAACTAQQAIRACFAAAWLVLALLLASTPLYAQSGRNKQPTGKPTTTGGTTRPKRATTTSGTPQPQPTPAVRLPSGTVVMDEAPPPPPAPRPTPTPVEDTSAGDDIGAEDIVRITSNLVTVPASVVDSQGRAVINLALEDFELRVDGQPRPITELSRAEVPVTMALLFDNSQSLSSAREFEKQAAVRFFRSVVRPIDRAAIYSVSTDVTLVQPLTNNVPALVRTIERFGKPEGATRLLDAIAEAAAYLRPYPGRKVIIIVSDGEDTLSDLDFDAVVRKTLAADCQVYAVQTKQIEYVMLTGQSSNANLQALAAERRMHDLTSYTGGAVYTPLQTRDLDTVFAQISADLAQQYILSYYPTDERNDGRFRTISVRVATRPNMRVRARRGYYPRRAGERLSFNTGETPAAMMPGPETGNFVSRESSSQTDNSPMLALNSAQPERQASAPSPRSSRIGPSETGELPVASNSSSSSNNSINSGKAAAPEQPPSVKREERASKPAEPQPTPAPPKPIASSSPPASNAKPPASNSTSAPPADTPATTPASKPVSGGVLNGKALYLPKPFYPPNARSARASGVVMVEVTLSEEGKVISARAVAGNPFLRQAAVDAARQARFTPTILSGKPVQVAGVINYNFNLSP